MPRARGVHPMGGNDAEIVIIAILGGKFAIFVGKFLAFRWEVNVCSFWGGRKRSARI